MKKTTVIVGLALTMLAVYAILNLVSIKNDLEDAMEQTRQLREEILAAQEENARLNEDITEYGSADAMAAQARQRLRLVGADETVFIDKD